MSLLGQSDNYFPITYTVVCGFSNPQQVFRAGADKVAFKISFHNLLENRTDTNLLDKVAWEFALVGWSKPTHKTSLASKLFNVPNVFCYRHKT